MKKTYITPAALAVELGTDAHMLQGSLKIYRSTGSGDPQITEGNQILTNENKSIWDEEW